MKKHKYTGWWAVLIILLLLIIDQVIKIWVKTHMHLYESIDITDWFKIVFIENNGMAYGMHFIWKPILTLFRIFAVGVIGYYLYKIVHREHRIGYVVCLVLIIAGAAGNIFDCLFYGQIFSQSDSFELSHFVPFGQGYASVLQGRVVDMFYFPLFHWPDWMPLIGGNVFFSPVFNFADSCISVGVVVLILFYRHDIENISQVFFEGTRFEKKQKESVSDSHEEKKGE